VAVVIVRDAPRCKLCRAAKQFGHPADSEVNLLLERRSNREKDGDGAQINADYVFARYVEMGIQNPNLENVKAHLKHIEFVHESLVAREQQDQAEAERQVREELSETSGADVADQIIDFELKVYLAKRRIQAERGDIDAATVDQVRALISEKTKRKHNDAQDELLKGLAAGVGGFISKTLVKAVAPALEPAPEPDVIEGVVVGGD